MTVLIKNLLARFLFVRILFSIIEDATVLNKMGFISFCFSIRQKIENGYRKTVSLVSICHGGLLLSF